MAKTLWRLLLILLVSVLLLESTLHGIAWIIRDDPDLRDFLAVDHKVRILCIGDSNTYGIYVEKTEAWPAQLQAILDQQRPNTYQVINLGYPGTPTYRLAESIHSWVDELHPDMVIVLAGFNDLFMGAIPARDSTAESSFSVHAWLVRHSRLYKFARLAIANAYPPEMANDADLAMDRLRSLRMIDADTDESAVALLFQDYFQIEGITVVQQDDGLWITRGDKAISARSVGKQLKGKEIVDQFGVLSETLMQLGVTQVEYNTSGGLRINKARFTLNYNLQAVTSKNRMTVAQENLAYILTALNQNKVDAVFLTYASDYWYYRAANQATRAFAASHAAKLIDIESKLEALCESDDCPEYFFPDQHPNAAGYRVMAQEIADYLLRQAPPKK